MYNRGIRIHFTAVQIIVHDGHNERRQRKSQMQITMHNAENFFLHCSLQTTELGNLSGKLEIKRE